MRKGQLPLSATLIWAPGKSAEDMRFAVSARMSFVVAVQGIVHEPAVGLRSAEAMRAPSREAFCARCPVKRARPKSAGMKLMTRKITKTSVNSMTACPDSFLRTL